jgi:hypothetical protein
MAPAAVVVDGVAVVVAVAFAVPELLAQPAKKTVVQRMRASAETIFIEMFMYNDESGCY